jgi:hypothetical protein
MATERVAVPGPVGAGAKALLDEAHDDHLAAPE